MFDKTVTGITYTLQIKTFICLTTPGKMEKNCTAECQKLLKFYILSEQENNEDSGSPVREADCRHRNGNSPAPTPLRNSRAEWILYLNGCCLTRTAFGKSQLCFSAFIKETTVVKADHALTLLIKILEVHQNHNILNLMRVQSKYKLTALWQ